MILILILIFPVSGDAWRSVFVPGRANKSGRDWQCALQDAVQGPGRDAVRVHPQSRQSIVESSYANNRTVSATNPKYN
jgi:hypothetical protein